MWGSCFSLGSRRSPPSAAAAPHASLLITHSLITHSLTHSLPHSLTHSLPPLPHSLTHGGAAEPSGEAAARVGAAGPRLALVLQRASWLRFAWQAQYTEPPGGAAARVAAAGPRLPFSWQAQYTELPGCVSRGRRSTQSLLVELRRAWSPLGPRLPFAWQVLERNPGFVVRS